MLTISHGMKNRFEWNKTGKDGIETGIISMLIFFQTVKFLLSSVQKRESARSKMYKSKNDEGSLRLVNCHN